MIGVTFHRPEEQHLTYQKYN